MLPALVLDADTNVGAVLVGVTEFEATDAEDAASMFVATALNV